MTIRSVWTGPVPKFCELCGFELAKGGPSASFVELTDADRPDDPWVMCLCCYGDIDWEDPAHAGAKSRRFIHDPAAGHWYCTGTRKEE